VAESDTVHDKGGTAVLNSSIAAEGQVELDHRSGKSCRKALVFFFFFFNLVMYMYMYKIYCTVKELQRY
jgi:hypothetical protein